jgi:hypothetical protein
LENGPSSLARRALSLGNNSLGKDMFWFFLQSQAFQLQLFVENTLIRIHIQKLWSNKISYTFVPWGNFNFFPPGNMIVPQGKKGLSCSVRKFKLLLPKDMIIP